MRAAPKAAPDGTTGTADGKIVKLATYQGHTIFEWMGVSLGFFLSIWIIPISFIFLYSISPLAVFAITACMFSFALYPLSGFHGHKLACVNLAWCMLATVGGVRCYYAHVYPMHSTLEGRVYSGVFSGQSATAFTDGAFVHFEGNARVDTNKALGMRTLEAEIKTYCVAPVVDDTFIGRAEFWAVGIDCCGERGSFECDDVGVQNSKTGFLLRDIEYGDPLYRLLGQYLTPDVSRRDLYEKAVAMAKSAHGVTSTDHPVFVRWVDRSREDLIQEEWRAIIGTLIAMAVFALVGTIMLTKLTLDYGDVQNYTLQLQKRIAAKYHAAVDIPLVVSMFIDEHHPHLPSKPAKLLELCIGRALVPYVVLMTCLAMWSFLHAFYIGNFLMLTFLVIIGIQIIGLLLSTDRYVYGLFMLVVTVVGIRIGEYNFTENTFRYFAVENHRSYSNVLPDASAELYRDAGKMTFAEGTSVRVAMSTGFKMGGTTYCAAPIMQQQVAQVPSVDFWAVGTNCCDAKGAFRCDGALDPKARGGVVFHDVGHEDSQTEINDFEHLNYLKAVRASTDTHGLTSNPDPLLLRFGPNLPELQWRWMNAATGIVVLSAIVSLQIFSCAALISCCYGKRLYRDRMIQFQQDLQLEHQKQQVQ